MRREEHPVCILEKIKPMVLDQLRDEVEGVDRERVREIGKRGLSFHETRR